MVRCLYVTEDSFMRGLRKSSITTISSDHPTIEFGPWNTGIVRWRKPRREAITSRVETFLIQHGSTRLCSGLIQYNTRIMFTCAQCSKEMRSRWNDLLGRPKVWCRSCLKKELMRGKIPPRSMTERAARLNREGAKRQRLLRKVSPPKNIPWTRETVRSQVRRLSKNWPASDWKVAMITATRVFQRCANPRASQYSYYGGRGIVVGFVSTAAMADWLLRHLGSRPSGKSLDRINTNGHYEPGNLRWATWKEQASNRNS